MARIGLQDVSKVFPGGQAALRDVDLTIADGERMALVGPSGSGKSTLLRIISGLDQPTTGRVFIGDRNVTDLPPEQRDLAMVFQSYALYPHKTVRENLAFGLRVRRVPAGETARRVHIVAESLGLGALLERHPAQLSGGQRQRVAVGRALVREPQAFLFDEPLSNLDPSLRRQTRTELVELHGRLSATMVYVTHDQEEAMTLGQRIAVLRDGRIEQVGTPSELYERPATVFVAGFIGSPPMNLLPVDQLWELRESRTPDNARTVGIRPHDLRVSQEAGHGAGVRAIAEVVEPLGHLQVVHAKVGATRLTAIAPPAPAVVAGQGVWISLESNRLRYFDALGQPVQAS